MQCFFVQLSGSCLFLSVIQQLFTSSFSSSRHFYPSVYLSFSNMFRKQFLRKVWTNQLAFLLYSVCIMLLPSLTVRNTSSLFTRSVQIHPSPAPPFKTYQEFPRKLQLLLLTVDEFHRNIDNIRSYFTLTCILLTWTIWRAPTDASKWRTGFNPYPANVDNMASSYRC